MAKLNIGLVGLGNRGLSYLKNVIAQHPDVAVVAIADRLEDRRTAAAALLAKYGSPPPREFAEARDLIHTPEVDAVVVMTGWFSHIPLAIEAMRAGKPVGIEVGGALSIEQCWRLVETSRATGQPCMMLENCCYGRLEMLAMNMAELGIFGELVHCAGGYHHDLREQVVRGVEDDHYRLAHYVYRNCENYPTHEFGPIGQLLKITRGNRILSLQSVASKAAGLRDYAARLEPGTPGADKANWRFNQGDIVTTVLKCAGGETVTLTFDTTLPRGYSRGFIVRGTRAALFEDTQSVFVDGMDIPPEAEFDWSRCWGNVKEFYERYEHPVWERYLREGVKAGHGGMDWLVFDDFVQAVREGRPLPIDVYDTATWMAVTILSEDSLALGGQPVAFPDFTEGEWMTRERKLKWI